MRTAQRRAEATGGDRLLRGGLERQAPAVPFLKSREPGKFASKYRFDLSVPHCAQARPASNEQCFEAEQQELIHSGDSRPPSEEDTRDHREPEPAPVTAENHRATGD